MSSSTVMRGLGKFLLCTGGLVLLFVAYQMWGTSILEARAQSDLRGEFEQALVDAGRELTDPADDPDIPDTSEPDEPDPEPDDPEPDDPEPDDPEPDDREPDDREPDDREPDDPEPDDPEPDDPEPDDPEPDDPEPDDPEPDDPEVSDVLSRRYGPPPAPPERGDAMARIRIPRLDLDRVVVSGVSVEDLRRGPGHFPSSPLPGQAGNAAIAGHRTTYGAPFYSLDELEEGDSIFVTTLQGAFEYRFVESFVVEPTAVEVLDDFGDNRLTLTTCHPRLSSRQRLIVVGELVGPPADGSSAQAEAEPVALPDEPEATTSTTSAPGTTDAPSTSSTASTSPERTTTTVVAVSGSDDTPRQGVILGDGVEGAGDVVPAVVWGLICALIWAAAWLTGRAWRRWTSYALVAPVFLVALFVFFGQISDFVPAGY